MVKEPNSTVSPEEMMEILHAPYPDEIRNNLRWTSLDMLQALYKENPNNPKVQEAQMAFKAVLTEWTDEKVADFLQNHLLQPPESIDMQSKTPAEQRQVLTRIYSYLFE